MRNSEERRSAEVWYVCVEGSEYSHIYSVHLDRAEADETARKLGYQFAGAYVSAPSQVGLDLPEPNEGETFWRVYGDNDRDWTAVPLAEWRSDDGFEDSVDYGATLRREIADGEVLSAPSHAAAIAAAKGGRS